MGVFRGDMHWLVQHLLEDTRPGAAPRVVLGIAGYPATGKTMAANELVARWTHGGVVLRTNLCILSGAERDRRGLSGCALPSYDLGLYRSLAERLIAGERLSLPSYQWTTHDLTGPLQEFALPDRGLLILEGPVVTQHIVADLCDHVCFLAPGTPVPWLESAIRRDLEERHYSRSESHAKNVAKARDMDSLFTATRSAVTELVRVSIEHTRTATRYEYAVGDGVEWDPVARCLPN